MRANLGRLVAVLVLVVSATGSACGEMVGFYFTAEEPDGRTMTGRFSYGAGSGAIYHFIDPRTGTGIGEFYTGLPMGAEVVIDGVEYLTAMGLGNDSYSLELAIVGNSAPGTGGDGFSMWLNREPHHTQPTFTLNLSDRDGTAFDTHLRLPSTLDLDQFETRRIAFYPKTGVRGFDGTITSLIPGAPAIVPEPSTLALCGTAALVGVAWLRQRRSRQAE